MKSLVGMVFGRLTVLSHDGTRLNCACSCGAKKTVARSNVTAGRTASCGCLGRELIAKRNSLRKMPVTQLKQAHPLYRTWVSMRSRCSSPYNKAFKNYGGRGIQVCQRWLSFDAFVSDMGDRPNGTSLERINNSAGYTPGNCRWATRDEQSRNRRNNVFVTALGVRVCFEDAIKMLGICRSHAHNLAKAKGSKQACVDHAVSALSDGSYASPSHYTPGLSKQVQP